MARITALRSPHRRITGARCEDARNRPRINELAGLPDLTVPISPGLAISIVANRGKQKAVNRGKGGHSVEHYIPRQR